MDKARFAIIKRWIEEAKVIPQGDIVKIEVIVDTFDKNISKKGIYTWRDEYEIDSGCSCLKCPNCNDKCHKCFKCINKEPRHWLPY